MKALASVVIVTLASTLHAPAAGAQTMTPEAVMTVGTSTEEEVKVVATQLRAFGELKSGIRYYLEGAWARSSDEGSDAFGSAYPYANHFDIIEAYGERMFRPRRAIVGVRAGRYRTPFGIHDASDHAYSGFTRAPLIRYGGYFALSNSFLEHGASLVVGIPRLTVETSLGAPADVGRAHRRAGLDAVVRGQGLLGPAIIGVSVIRTPPYQPVQFAPGQARFTGVDVRWMRDGVQLRGEWIKGAPSADRSTEGWYADAIIHRVFMGPVTAVARVEKLDYPTPTGAFAVHSGRQTVGVRLRIIEGLSASVNVFHHTGLVEDYGPHALDVSVTYAVRRR